MSCISCLTFDGRACHVVQFFSQNLTGERVTIGHWSGSFRISLLHLSPLGYLIDILILIFFLASMQGTSLSTVALGATLTRPAKDSSIKRHQNSPLEPLLLNLNCSEKASGYKRLPMRVISVKPSRFNNQGSRIGPFLVVQANPSKKVMISICVHPYLINNRKLCL